MERPFWGRGGAWNPWAGAPGNDTISIAQLVANHTLSAEMAGTLWAAVDDKQLSFLSVAMPQGAGKTTTAGAVLALRPPEIDLHFVYAEPSELQALQQEKKGGYIVVGEISRAPMPSYIWGRPVQAVFDTLAAGYSLQTSLHATSVDQALQVVTRGNGISDEQASNLRLVLYIEVYQTNRGEIARRLVDLYEIDRVQDGLPRGRSLFTWHIEDDSFEAANAPQTFGDASDIARRAAVIQALVDANRVTPADVAEAVTAFRAS